MATFQITAPDGTKYRITGDTQEGALAALREHLGDVEEPSAAPEKVGLGSGIAANLTQGILMGGGDEYLAGLSAVAGLQPDGNGGSTFFNYDKPISQRYDTALGAIREEFGEFKEDRPKTAMASQLTGNVVSGVGAGMAAPVKAAATLGGRVKQAAAGGAALGAVEGFNSGEGDFGERIKGAGIGGGVGAVFAPLIGLPMAAIAGQAQVLGGKALRAVFTNKRFYNRNSGQITKAGLKRLEKLGIDPAQLSDEMTSALGVAADKATGTVDDTAEAVARTAKAERFNVPLTRGQSTGDVIQTGAEESMRAGARGQGAYKTMEGFDNTQKAAIQNAREGIGQEIGGNATGRIDAAEAIIEGVGREAENARLAGRAAYQALDESGAAIRGSSAVNLDARLQNRLRLDRVTLDADTKNANSALNVLKGVFEDAGQGSVPFSEIERARQRITALNRAAFSGSNGTDQVAISSVLKEFDDWVDDTITNALVSGDDAVLGQAKNARALWAQYRQTYLGKQGADNFIRKIVEDELAPDQVANWIYGAGQKIGGGQTSLVARRLKNILGADSAEFSAVKRAAWDRIAPEDAGAQKVLSNIQDLLNGKGRTLARELFTEKERRVIAEFGDFMKVLVPPARSTNPSGTAHALERSVGQFQQILGGILGGASGGMTGAIAGREAVRRGSDFSSTLAARAATAGLKFKPASPAVATGAGVGFGSQIQDATGQRQ